jgi:hypothetical protein
LISKHSNYIRLGDWVEAEELRISLEATALEIALEATLHGSTSKHTLEHSFNGNKNILLMEIKTYFQWK